MELSAWKDKRLVEMSADELRAALQDIWRMYCDVNAKKMTSSDVPKFTFSMARADAKLADICEHGLPKARYRDEVWSDVSITWSDATRTDIELPNGAALTIAPASVERLREGVTLHRQGYEIRLDRGKLVCRENEDAA